MARPGSDPLMTRESEFSRRSQRTRGDRSTRQKGLAVLSLGTELGKAAADFSLFSCGVTEITGTGVVEMTETNVSLR